MNIPSLRLAILGAGCLLSSLSYGQASEWFVRVPPLESGLIDTLGVQTVSVADINNDNYPDVIMVHTPPNESIYTVRKPIKIYLNTQAPGTSDPRARRFIDVTSQSLVNIVPPDTGNNANCFTLADFNNDGNLDLITGNYYHRLENYTLTQDRAQIYLGDGTGNFTWKPGNGLDAAGLINVRLLSALDFDRDGNLDVFIPTWFKDYTKNIWDHAYLFKGNGDGTFTDVTNSSGLNAYLEPMYGAASVDWNNDCFPDILTAPYCRTGGKLFKNEGNGRFTNVSAAAGFDLQRMGQGQASCTFSVIPEDVNNDGYMDAFLAVVHGGNQPGEFRSTIAINKGPDHNYAFEINENLLPVKPPASYHRGDYDAAFLDMDNDGLKDLVMVQSTYQPATDRTYFWKQQPDGSFKDVTADLGLVVPALKNSLGIEAFDYDLDGDDDLLIVGTNGTYFDLWENKVGSKNNWISVHAAPMPGTGINMSGIGARVYVYYDGKMQMREIMAGRGMHTGQQPFILNFGLGNAEKVDSVAIQWPDASCSRKVIYNPPVNKRAYINSFPTDVAHVPAAATELKIFPNPTEGYVVLQAKGLAEETRDIQIADITGKQIHAPATRSEDDKLIVDLNGAIPGIYLIQVTDGKGQVTTHRVTKR
jgi:hypothetical protein